MGDRGQKADQTRKQSGDGITVYNRVRLLRQERRLSQNKLAGELGINHRTVGYLERQDYEPSLSLAWRIAWFFEVPLETVFSPEPFRSLSEHLRSRDEQDSPGGINVAPRLINRGPCQVPG